MRGRVSRELQRVLVVGFDLLVRLGLFRLEVEDAHIRRIQRAPSEKTVHPPGKAVDRIHQHNLRVRHADALLPHPSDDRLHVRNQILRRFLRAAAHQILDGRVDTAAEIGRLAHLRHRVFNRPIRKPIQRLLALRWWHVKRRLRRLPHLPLRQLRFVQDADDRRDRRQQTQLARLA